MTDAVPFIRQWGLLRKLTARGALWTLRELADDFGVTTKTIRRDLDALSLVGFRTEERVGPHGEKSWRIETDSILSGLVFDFEEATALYLGRRFLEPLAGTPLWDAAQRAFRKLELGFGKQALTYLDKFATAFHQTAVGGSDYSARGDMIDQLMIGVEDRCVCALDYQSSMADSASIVHVHPYGFVYHRSSLYLVAFAPHRDQLRHYKVDRINSVNVTSKCFDRPSDFQLADHLTGTFGVYHSNDPPHQVRIRFNQDAAQYIREHRWHPSQTLTDQPDGSILVELQLTDLHEVKAWVLSFGAKAVVECPEELRKLVSVDLQSLREFYK
ncbi:MAG: WYL domain-containing protein [Planctomycetaceae bacterium]|nr:WYL domain-containing protein [Planctomycetaceae bacterium]MCB9953599.1 WYL domain-containing protein [Planctomycetaceae bacterium]